MKKRKLIIASGAVALVTPLFFIGCFFLYWGAWNYLFGSRIGLFFGLVMAVFGVFMIIIGIIGVLKLIPFLEELSE